MSNNDRQKKTGSGGPTPRFGVREDRPIRQPPRPIDRQSDVFGEISDGKRSVTLPATAVRERPQRQAPRITREPIAEVEPEHFETAATRAADFVRRAESIVAPRQQERPPAYDRGGATVLGFELSGPMLAGIISIACLAILYLLWSQPPETRFSDYPGRQPSVAELPQVNPAEYPQVAAPPGESTVIGPPTIGAEDVERILAQYGSPAVGTGQTWVNLGIQYKIDPAYAVAFFIHESSAGTAPGWAGIKPDGTTTHNVGNIICAGYPTCFNRFRDYPNWETGIEDWYKLIAVEYIEGRGAHTVEQIIPIYAPSFENNVPRYVQAVNDLVREWRAARGAQ